MELKPLPESAPLLKTVASPYKFPNPISYDGEYELTDLVASMITMLNDYHLIGLAAPQVGIPLRILVTGVRGIYRACINPRVIQFGSNRLIMEEGCLSVPNCFVSMRRPATVDAMYQDVAGAWKRTTLTSMEARVFQHEIDHLNGLLINDKKTTAVRELVQIGYATPNTPPMDYKADCTNSPSTTSTSPSDQLLGAT
jgi:peptide deformylase